MVGRCLKYHCTYKVDRAHVMISSSFNSCFRIRLLVERLRRVPRPGEERHRLARLLREWETLPASVRLLLQRRGRKRQSEARVRGRAGVQRGYPPDHCGRDGQHHVQAWLPDGYSQIFRSYAFGPSGLKDYGSATLHCKI